MFVFRFFAIPLIGISRVMDPGWDWPDPDPTLKKKPDPIQANQKTDTEKNSWDIVFL